MGEIAEQVIAEYFNDLWWGDEEPQEYVAEVLEEEAGQ